MKYFVISYGFHRNLGNMRSSNTLASVMSKTTNEYAFFFSIIFACEMRETHIQERKIMKRTSDHQLGSLTDEEMKM